MRAAPALVSLVAVLAALAACGPDAEPRAPAADPSPAARSQAASPATTPTPTPAPPPTPAPALAPLPSTFAPGDRSSAVQPPFEAPGFSLATGFGERVALQDLLAEHEAVVLVFYRGFF